MVSSFPRLGVAALLAAALALVSGCSVNNPPSYKEQVDLEVRAAFDLERAAEEVKELIEYVIGEKLDKGLAELRSDFEYELALANSHADVVKTTLDYTEGLGRTRQSAADEYTKLMGIYRKIVTASQAFQAALAMAQADLELAEEAYQNFLNVELPRLINGAIVIAEQKAEQKRLEEIENAKQNPPTREEEPHHEEPSPSEPEPDPPAPVEPDPVVPTE